MPFGVTTATMILDSKGHDKGGVSLKGLLRGALLMSGGSGIDRNGAQA
ncbi:MAG: hypothetical protein LBL58_17760 [Tannerellaceae bacterium]|nr:hypothetical protein [Tannerellaceae bacterium]